MCTVSAGVLAKGCMFDMPDLRDTFFPYGVEKRCTTI